MFKRKIEEIASAIYRRIFYPFVRMAVEIRTKSIMKQGSYLNKGSVLEGRNYIGRDVRLSNVRVGFGSYVNNGCDVSNTRIGRYTSIGAGVSTELGSHPTDGRHVALHPAFYSRGAAPGYSYAVSDTYDEMKYIDVKDHIQVVIGNDVWIGNNVSIIEGVTIGDGAVIAAGSVVTKDVEAYGIYAGVPAKKIGSRFTDEQTEGLKRARWWDMNEDDLKRMTKEGLFDDVEAFLKSFGS